MKKILFFAALVLGMASCQTEPEGLDVMVGGEQEVMLNVSLPESTRSASSAGFDFTNFESNGQYDLRFILEIAYNGTVVREVNTSKTTSTTFPVRLVPGREYTFTVWADLVNEGSKADLYYNILSQDKANNEPVESVLDNIMINIDKWTPNVELRDAYYGRRTLLDTESIAQIGTITLFRPFAKVRVVATDIADVTKFGITPNKANITYRVPMYTAFNAVDGTVAGSATTISPIPYNIVADAYTENTNELTVFADYIFVPEGGNIQFDLNINQDGDLIKSNSFSTAIPVEANKVTSIVGDVLTEGGNVSITVDGALGEKETINYVDNAESLQEAINAIEEGKSGNIKLGGNVDLNDLFIAGTLSTRAEKQYGLEVPAGKSVVLDLNGCTISQTKECTANYSMIVNKGNLTITDNSVAKNGTISFKDTGAGDPNFGWGSYTLRNEGTLVVENGTIKHLGEQNPGNGQPNVHMYCAIFQYSGKSTINGGVISTPTYRSVRLWSGDMTINGGEFEGQLWLQAVNNNSNLTINGGTFAPRGNDGSSVFVTNDTYTVNFAVNGGHFTTKIGMSKPFGCITGGTFTTAAKENTAAALINDDYAWVEAEGLWTLARKADVAKIGEVGYTSLAKAVAAVKDGETITLVANEVFTENNYYDNGGWKDGLGYAGDNSFTIDLGGNTISQDGYLNDYLLWFKNVGSKANTITIKNGTLDAGTTAYSALCTASSHENKLTVNIENINLVGNNSSGAVAKIRGGSELNVKAGTIITGANNYVGIEAVGNNTVVNIYDNAKIYQNGTDSYVGAIVGASYNATMNIYGGYGKSAKCGIIVMSTGATINVSGGEWIANNDGTVATDNKAVLVSQNNRYETGWACKSILNVTGGTFKGGYNCYGMGPGVEPDDAQINIKGGNFNANPASYVAEDFVATEDNGVWTVKMTEEAKLRKVLAEGGEVTLLADINTANTLVVTTTNPVVINGNGKTLTSTAARAINVSGATNVTIKNLTINASGERAINVIQNATNITIDNVTATAANYTVNVAGSAPNAVVAIKNSTLNGLCTVNVAAAGAYVTVDGSTVNCNDNNTTAGEAYAALSLNREAVGGKIIATNTTINVAEGSDSLVARNGAEDGVVTIDGSDEDVAVMYAVITYPDSNYYHSFATIAKAVEFAKSGDVITLIRNVELTEPLIIATGKTLTLDLNGYNITSNIAGNPENFELFSVNGELEIKGNGTISLTSEDFEWNTSHRYTAINIREKGVVTLGNGVSVICEASKDGSYGMSYAVDIYTTGTLNINGASLHSNYIAVRCFYGNSVVNVNSGSKITSSKNNYGIWLQSSPGAVVTIADDVNYTFDNNIYYFN